MSNKKIDLVVSDIENLKRYQPGTPWAIVNVGKALILRSGKSTWRTEGHAKSALTNHFSAIYNYSELKKMGFTKFSELTQYILNTGILKIQQI